MAKDGTARGGARVGAGRKPKALTDKIAQGGTGPVLAFPDPADLSGEDVPPVKDCFDRVILYQVTEIDGHVAYYPLYEAPLQ